MFKRTDVDPASRDEVLRHTITFNKPPPYVLLMNEDQTSHTSLTTVSILILQEFPDSSLVNNSHRGLYLI